MCTICEDEAKPWPSHSTAERRYVYAKLEDLKNIVSNMYNADRWEERRIQVRLWDLQQWVYPEYNQGGRNT